MKALLGYKVGMTQIIEDDGTVVPITVIQAGPCYVTQVKSIESDGYEAVQIGFDETKEKRLNKAQRGHLGLLKKDKSHPHRKADIGMPNLRYLREFRTPDVGDYELGQTLTVDTFTLGERVDVTGKTKGRGFTGVVKRHGFAGGPKTHGQSDRHRAPGSIGSTSSMSRVIKGMKMAGRTGNKRKTSEYLEVVRVDLDRNLLAVRGAVPGVKGGLVMIRTSAKARRTARRQQRKAEQGD